MSAPKYNLSSAQAVAELRDVLALMEAEEDRNQLTAITADEAYERGFAYAIAAFESLTGPAPKEKKN